MNTVPANTELTSVLMLSSTFPWPANTGGRVRIAALLEGLSRYYHIVFVAPHTSGNPAVVPDEVRHNQQIEVHPIQVDSGPTWKVRAAARFAFMSTPAHCALYAYPEVRSYVRQLLLEQRFDLVYCHFLYALEYLPAIVNPPVVLDQQNADRLYWLRRSNSSSGIYSRIARWNLRNTVHYENAHFERLRVHVSVSNEERDIVKTTAKVDPRTVFLVAPNGVDLAHYAPQESQSTQLGTETLTIGFVGSMDLKDNNEAALRLVTWIWPQICEALPDTKLRLLIVGRNPSSSLVALAKSDQRIDVTGTVPDMKPWLTQIDVMLLPLVEGSGTKLRVVEAMACAVPVVGTEIAMEGLGGVDGRDYLVCRYEPDLVNISVAVLGDKAWRQRIGCNARTFVEQNCGWTSIVDKLAEDLDKVIGQ